jgi:dipeptidyl aminopeptidase/acylaminoacyl peptidase
MRARVLIPCLVLLAPAVVQGQEKYQHPPTEIMRVFDAPAPPIAFPSPTGDAVLLARPLYYPPISDLSEPLLRLAGVRINPRNNGVHGSSYFVAYWLKKLPDGDEVPVALPAGTRASLLSWNATGTAFAFVNHDSTSVELWVCDVATTKAHRIPAVRLNPVLGYTLSWMADQTTLLVKTVPAGRPGPPEEPAAPIGPRIEESGQVETASSTYEARDLLRTAHDADLFEYYAASQLALVNTTTDTVTRIGTPGPISKVLRAPGGKYLLVERINRPYSFLRPYERFATDVELLDAAGNKVATVARQPLAEEVPIDGVRTGPRGYAWRPTAPATLIWAEALDGGDTYKKVPYHDRVMMQTVGGPAVELAKTQQRFAGLQWIEQGGLALLAESDLDKHWNKTVLLDVEHRKTPPRVIWDLSSDDRYRHPGGPVFHQMRNGAWAVRVHDGAIFMSGQGASPEGNRPFLDRVDLPSLKTVRLFRSDHESLEYFFGWVDPGAGTFLTRRESPSDPPNLFLRTLGKSVAADSGEAMVATTSRQLTHVTDPSPQLRQITKKLVTFQRPDGVQLSFTLYLPPGYTPGTRLPTVLWAYPLDYTDPAVAGQVEGSPRTFTTIIGASPLFLVLEGYAVLNNSAMPVVGPSETAYDTFIEQIIANAKAAIDKAVELGVTDPDRVGVMGHSHGALMTANLLAWSDLFRAGVARSGAYNHTLRPFGFQNERRTLYKATDTYLKLSPLLHADRIDEPLLLIHGERDVNPGTVPLQSEKLFEAVRGVGGKVRLVVLPSESHGYIARESNEQALYEIVAWFDRYVKNAGPRAKHADAKPAASSQP